MGNEGQEAAGGSEGCYEVGGISLRDYQHEMILGLREAYASGARAPMLLSPTGSGKTRTGAAMVSGARSKGLSVAWVCDRLELIEQASATFDQFGMAHGVIQGNHPRWRPYEKLQVASIQTLARRDIEPFDLVIIDEAHILHEAHKKILAGWTKSKFLGLSATPFTAGLGRHFDRLVQGPSVKKLIERGFLVPFKVWAPTEPDLTGVKVVAGEWQEAELAKAMNTTKVVGDIVQNWVEKAYGRQTIVFAVDVAHSKHIAEQFNAVGVSARHIDGYMPLEERQPIVAAYRRGEFTVLVNCGIVDKGFDAPETSCLIQARPIRSSLALHIQQIGRALRTAPGKEDAIILDHAGNHLRHGMATDPLPNELDDGRKKKVKAKKKEHLPKPCPKCQYVKPPKCVECPSCGFTPARQNVEFAGAGELQEFRGNEERKNLYQMLRGMARARGYADGWAAHQFKAVYKDWPPYAWRSLPVLQPTTEVVEMVARKMRGQAIRKSYAAKKEARATA